jgi:hypothetical protein
VVIEFSAAKAAFVRARIWHPTQIFEELPDGRVRIAFSCASLIPVVSWVLEWGPYARAIEPPSSSPTSSPSSTPPAVATTPLQLHPRTRPRPKHPSPRAHDSYLPEIRRHSHEVSLPP